MVFHMLRTMIGDEQFFASLKQFIAAKRSRPRGRYQDHFEKQSGKDLSAFFKHGSTGKAFGGPR